MTENQRRMRFWWDFLGPIHMAGREISDTSVG